MTARLIRERAENNGTYRDYSDDAGRVHTVQAAPAGTLPRPEPETRAEADRAFTGGKP